MSSLAQLATGRSTSFFAADLEAHSHELRTAISGARILAIGAAGSIGSSTISILCRYSPRAVHVVDQNENALAELIRQFRSAPDSGRVNDMRTWPLDYGAPAMERLLAHEGPYDVVLNFAAIKHVRSEKDPYSLLQMIDTNLVKQARLLRWVSTHTPGCRYFSVSTDKAANPSSFMGATKRLMEHVIFSASCAGAVDGRVTSARFANVAFSNGSLLQSFQNRLARYEPIACPNGIRRYFVSVEESGEICTLACLLVDPRHIAIPRLDPETCLVSLRDVAEGFIRHHGYEPSVFTDEEKARTRCRLEIAAGRWPLLLTRGDTVGEKPFEEFLAHGERSIRTSLRSLDAIHHRGPEDRAVCALIDELEGLVLGRISPTLSKDGLKALIGRLEPAFLATHRDSELTLDERM